MQFPQVDALTLGLGDMKKIRQCIVFPPCQNQKAYEFMLSKKLYANHNLNTILKYVLKYT